MYERTSKIRKDIYGLRKHNKSPEDYIYVKFATKKKLVGRYLPTEEVIDECSKKIKDITKELNEQEIRLTSQKDIKQSRISYILHNEKHTSRYSCNSNEYPNMFPPIIDK